MRKALIALIFLCGCATSGRIARLNLGMNKSEVISALGKPVSISAKDNTEYLNYRFSETNHDANWGIASPYFVRLIDGKVDSFGRTGDFDSTKPSEVRLSLEK